MEKERRLLIRSWVASMSLQPLVCQGQFDLLLTNHPCNVKHVFGKLTDQFEQQLPNPYGIGGNPLGGENLSALTLTRKGLARSIMSNSGSSCRANPFHGSKRLYH